MAGCHRGPYSLAPPSSGRRGGQRIRKPWRGRSSPANGSGQSGRLGNQLFQIAATIGTRERTAWILFFQGGPFPGILTRAVPQASVIPETDVYCEPSFAYNEIRVRRPTDLAGCFQSERYFKHCEAEIRGYFAPRGRN